MSVSSRERFANKIVVLVFVAVLAAGLWLRWRFVQTVQLYPDEFVTLLAVQRIRDVGLPVMPSGLFYDHGLLFSYLGSLASELGPARVAVRYASLLCGGLTLLLTFWLGQRWFSPAVGLIAAAGLALAPTAIQWSGRARMYALLQLLILLTVWLAYEGTVQKRAHLRWLALVAYFGATLTHFAAVTLAPPLVLAIITGLWLEKKTAEQRRNPTIADAAAPGSQARHPTHGFRQGAQQKWMWLELLALGGVLTIAFLVKRAGQPKGIEALDGSAQQALAGLVQVFNIYSDFSLNFLDGWQAISSFYMNSPALIFTLFALVTVAISFARLLDYVLRRDRAPQEYETKRGDVNLISVNDRLEFPAIFLSIILVFTTLEMILLVSPDRRDDKYQFMLLPILLLLGAQGVSIGGRWMLALLRQRSTLAPKFLCSKYQLPCTNHQLSLIEILPLLLAVLLVAFAWPGAQNLLSNTGDDYDSAFAYVLEHWQDGDTVLTGTPSAAAFYLGRNDFYSVQRPGGYDYRILTVNDQAVDRWLASPVIRTEADLHQTLTHHRVWLVLERWGLQREYYDLSFQQQLLAQTDFMAETQGIFILRSKPEARPISPSPAHRANATLGDLIQLKGYTVEPDRVTPGLSLRLTLYWQALGVIPEDYTVFVHLRHLDGRIAAQADHRPLGSLFPTSLWPTAETIRESSELVLPADLPPGKYELWIGLYLLETGQRLPVKNDASGENAVRLGVLSVEQ